MCDTAPMSPAETSRQNLVDHGLPTGLLPHNVAAVELDPSGRFRVALTEGVERTVESYRVRYGTEIRGTMTHGRIDGLSGVQVKRGLWIRVSAMTADGDQLIFSVGPVKKRLPASAFSA